MPEPFNLPRRTEQSSDNNEDREREAAIGRFVVSLQQDVERELALAETTGRRYSPEHKTAVQDNAEYDFAKVATAIREGKPVVVILHEESQSDSGHENYLNYIYVTLAVVDGAIKVTTVHNVLTEQIWPTDPTAKVLPVSQLAKEKLLAIAEIGEGSIVRGNDFFGVQKVDHERYDTTVSRSLYAARSRQFEDAARTSVSADGTIEK